MPLDLVPGPSVVVEPDTPSVCEAVLRIWASIAPGLVEDTVELHSNYFDGGRVLAPHQVWESMIRPTIMFESDGNFEFTCTFTWQHRSDPHTVTFYIEDGRLCGCSVDG